MTALRRYQTLDSTNEEARRLAAAGERGPLWIVAERQTAGRGRRGRSWESEPGNLFATLLLGGALPLERRAQLSFVAALAASDCVAHYAQDAVTLKWPNDVLLAGRKLGGILLESTGAVLAIGIGINLARFPARTDFPAISIAALTGTAPPAGEAINLLASAWEKWFATWGNEGFAPVRQAWLARAAGLGDKIRAIVGEAEMHGLFEDLDQDGALLMRRADGVLSRVSAGEIFFR